ncbi:hypothetical protein [Sphingomonas dokdonensis]|nr:hypothetical protein [Sphingomonas dokdonensis]
MGRCGDLLAALGYVSDQQRGTLRHGRKPSTQWRWQGEVDDPLLIARHDDRPVHSAALRSTVAASVAIDCVLRPWCARVHRHRPAASFAGQPFELQSPDNRRYSCVLRSRMVRSLCSREPRRHLMRKTIILHIGASKAGSSSIQSFIRRNRPLLNSLGYVVPDISLGTGENVSGEHVFALEALAKARDAAGFRARMDAVFAQSGDAARAVLLSAENLSNLGNSAIIEGLSAQYDLRIVMYLRRQDELLTSAWQQWASKIETDFYAWLIMALKQFGHWNKVLAEWEQRAGADAIVARVFDRNSFVDGDLLHDFIDALGLAEHIDAFDYKQGESNPSVTDAITMMVSGNRKIFSDVHDNRFYGALNELTGNNLVDGKKVSLLSRKQRDKVIEYYRPVNEAVCRKYFKGRPRLFPVVDHEKYRYLSSDQLVDEKFRAIMTIIAALVQERAG